MGDVANITLPAFTSKEIFSCTFKADYTWDLGQF